MGAWALKCPVCGEVIDSEVSLTRTREIVAEHIQLYHHFPKPSKK